MSFKGIALCAAALLAVSSSCFAMDSGYYYRIDDGKLFGVTVLSHDGFLKGSDEPAHFEFINLRNNADEAYSSSLVKSGENTYTTASGFITNAETEKGQSIDGYFRGTRLGQGAADFSVEDLGQGKIRVSSNTGLVKGFGFDGIYQREATFLSAPDSLALHALETIAQKTGYLAVGDIDYQYRVLPKDDGTGYRIQAWQDNALSGEFDVRTELGVISFLWKDKPIELFRMKD